MKLLITGAGGYIGRSLVQAFHKDGYEVIAAYRHRKPDLQPGPSSLKLVRADLGNKLDHLEPVEAIIHTAALTHLIPNASAEDYVNSNVTGMLNLTAYARAAGVRLVINLSTISVYGDVYDPILNEDTPLHKPGLYGVSKYLGELMLEAEVGNFSALCIRLPGVVGPGAEAPWLGGVLKKLQRNEPVTAYNPEALFNNVVDLAELKHFLMCVLKSDFQGFETVTLSASAPLTVREVLEIMVAETGSTAPIRWSDTPGKSFIINTQKTETLFSYTPSSTKNMVLNLVKANMAKTSQKLALQRSGSSESPKEKKNL